MNITSIILTILIFSLLIIVHELGHFVTAKMSGVTVNEFWLGMGPTIFRKVYKGTDYQIKLLPFGGAVVMEGEDAYSKEEGSFGSIARWKKAIIMAAGSFMNFVLGFIIVCFLVFPTNILDKPVIEDFALDFPYENAEGLLVGDEILSIDGYNILEARQDISLALSRNATAEYDIEILRDGEKITLEDFSFLPNEYTLENGDTYFGYGLIFETYEPNFFEKIEASFITCVNYVRMVYLGLFDMISGTVGLDEMAGPVGITQVIGEAASISMSAMWRFVAFISINLGVMNLLPLPALDGGRLLFLAIESIRRKPLDQRIEGAIHAVGLILLLGLMLIVTINDIFFK